MKIILFIAALIIPSVSYYVYSINKQIKDVEKVCTVYYVGKSAKSLNYIENIYSVKLMSIYPIEENPGTSRATVCAFLTMCDTSCTIEFSNDIVTMSKVSRF